MHRGNECEKHWPVKDKTKLKEPSRGTLYAHLKAFVQSLLLQNNYLWTRSAARPTAYISCKLRKKKKWTLKATVKSIAGDKITALKIFQHCFDAKQPTWSATKSQLKTPQPPGNNRLAEKNGQPYVIHRLAWCKHRVLCPRSWGHALLGPTVVGRVLKETQNYSWSWT